MKLKYTFVTVKGEENFIATVPEFPGVVAQAKTMEEIFPKVKDAISVYIKTLENEKLAVPQSFELIGVNQVEISNE